MFSAEEINLMCIFDTSTKEKLLDELRTSLKDVYDPDMRDIYETAIEKLETITEADFSEIGLYIADEFTDGEEYDIAE
jgi:hypothetical protein